MITNNLHPNNKGYFITGTDTGVGKTYVALHLMRALKRNDPTQPLIGLKPIASGCDNIPDGLRNDDAMQLQHAATVELPYEAVNPFAFAPPIAPHIAAQQVGVHLSVSQLLAHYHALQHRYPTAKWVIEGAGGWSVPLNQDETLGDFACALNLSVILVVDMKLGCINHACLTQHALDSANVTVAGWVANKTQPTPLLAYEDNIMTLKQRLKAPLLDIITYEE